MIRKTLLLPLVLMLWVAVPAVYGQSCATADDIMSVQANLPISGQTVQMLPLGAVALEDLVEQPATSFIEVSPRGVINVRSGPSTNDEVLTALNSAQTGLADGRVVDTTWLHVRLPEGGDGWMFADLLTSDEDKDSLAVISTAPVASPMQVFQLTSADVSSDCAIQGVLLQSPLDTIPTTLNANGVDLEFQGTILIQLSDALTVQALEGSVTVAAGGPRQTAIAGAEVTIPLDEKGLATGDYGEIQVYEADTLAVLDLPLDLLAREIEIAPPLTANELADLLTCTISASNNVTLREGPSTLYSEVGSLAAGESAEVIGQSVGNEGIGWWQLMDESWVRSDLVDAGLNCETKPEAEVPPLPTSDQGMPLGTEFRIAVCDFPPQMAAGDLISFWIGSGSSPTLADAQQTLPDYVDTAYLSVDDEPLQTGLVLHTWNIGDYGVRVIGNWVATAGTHTVAGTLTGGESQTCSFTIAEPAEG